MYLNARKINWLVCYIAELRSRKKKTKKPDILRAKIEKPMGKKIIKTVKPKTPTPQHLRLVFKRDEVIDGVVIRNVERYDLVKIKPTESKVEHAFRSLLSRLWSSEN